MVPIVHFHQRHLEYFPMSLNILQKYYLEKTWFRTAALHFITWINRTFNNGSPILGQSGYFQHYGVINNTETSILVKKAKNKKMKQTLFGSLEFFRYSSRGGVLMGHKVGTFKCLLEYITSCEAERLHLVVSLPGGSEWASFSSPFLFWKLTGPRLCEQWITFFKNILFIYF